MAHALTCAHTVRLLSVARNFRSLIFVKIRPAAARCQSSRMPLGGVHYRLSLAAAMASFRGILNISVPYTGNELTSENTVREYGTNDSPVAACPPACQKRNSSIDFFPYRPYSSNVLLRKRLQKLCSMNSYLVSNLDLMREATKSIQWPSSVISGHQRHSVEPVHQRRRASLSSGPKTISSNKSASK